MKNLGRIIIGLFTSIMLVVCAADLIYLYFAGGWYDPIVLIERAELGCLVIFVALGIFSFVLFIKDLFKLSKE